MFKALDLTINSLESGSVVGKLKRQKTGYFFFLFPLCGTWSQAKSLTTVTLCSVLLMVIIIFGSASVQK